MSDENCTFILFSTTRRASDAYLSNAYFVSSVLRSKLAPVNSIPWESNYACLLGTIGRQLSHPKSHYRRN